MRKIIEAATMSLFIFITVYSSVDAIGDKRVTQKEFNMTDKTTLIVTSSPNLKEQESLKKYVVAVMPLLLNLGGTVVKRSMITDTYHGKNNFTFLLVMDFPSKQALTNMFDSDTYKALIPEREKGFENINIFFADNLE
jgi:uncharacterized protein (DUF1330 family)